MPTFFSEPRNTNTDTMLEPNQDTTFGTHRLNLGDPSEDVGTIYIVGKNLEDVKISGGMGLGLDTRDPYYDGLQYFYVDSITRLTGDIILNTTGNNALIEKVYLLEELFYIPDEDNVVRMDMGRREIGAIVHEDIYNDYSKIAGKLKRRVAYSIEHQTKEKEREFEVFRENNAEFIFMEDFNYYPDRVYPAMFERDVSTSYTIPVKGEGVSINFEVKGR